MGDSSQKGQEKVRREEKKKKRREEKRKEEGKKKERKKGRAHAHPAVGETVKGSRTESMAIAGNVVIVVERDLDALLEAQEASEGVFIVSLRLRME